MISIASSSPLLMGTPACNPYGTCGGRKRTGCSKGGAWGNLHVTPPTPESPSSIRAKGPFLEVRRAVTDSTQVGTIFVVGVPILVPQILCIDATRNGCGVIRLGFLTLVILTSVSEWMNEVRTGLGGD